MKTKYLSGTADANYEPGRAQITSERSSVEEDPFSLEDPLWGVYGDTRYVADWTQRTDERLDAISAELYDLADRFNMLIIVLSLWFILTVAALGALIIVDL